MFNNGEVKGRIGGLRSKEEVAELIDGLL